MSSSTTSPDLQSGEFNPDDMRMSLGEHLEELRSRMIYAIVGFVAALSVCLWYGKDVVQIFCRPLTQSLLKYSLNPQIYTTQASDTFMVYMNISLICATAIASPWIVYQLWLFVAAGLYPRERKYITRYVPLSVGLLVTGMAFVYFYVLPWTLEFFIAFSITIPLPADQMPSGTPTTQTASGPLLTVPAIAGDPATPGDGQMWFNTAQNRLKFHIGNEIRVLQFGPENLMAPMYTLPDYIDMVVAMLLTFGLCFQLPLVVLAVVRIGIVEVGTLRAWRRYFYFAMVVVAAVITPGDAITATLALTVPLILLYELGIFLSAWGQPPEEATES